MVADFEAVIRRAIENDIRRNFQIFLLDYEHYEGGRRRAITPAEAMLVKEVLDSFLLAGTLSDLDLPDVDNLVERLATLSAGSGQEVDALRNACFDALACIRADLTP